MQDVWRLWGNRVVSDGVDVDLLRLVVESGGCAERSHSSVFKAEFGHVEFRSGLGCSEKMGDKGFSRRLSAEFHGIEIDQVENVLYIDVLQLGDERIGSIFTAPTVDDEVLAVVGNGQMVDGEVVFAIDNRARLDCPHCVANRDV